MERLGRSIEECLNYLIETFGEAFVGNALLGVMSFVFFLSGYLIIRQQWLVRKKGLHTTGEIVYYESSSSIASAMPAVKFLLNGKQVVHVCRPVRMKVADYPIGTIVDIVCLEKKAFGFRTIIVYVDNENLRNKQGLFAAMVMCGFGALILIKIISLVIH